MLALYKKQLKKAYKKRFKVLNKSFFDDRSQGMLVFNEYLKYLRDFIILNTDNALESDIKNTRIATINTAIAELCSWQKAVDEQKKDFHWNNFCELLRLNMKEWLVPNDSI